MEASPTPERIFGTLTAYQTSAALAAAIELELFTHVAAGKDTLPALAKATGASERGLRALANHLVAREFLTKRGARYRCTEEAARFLDRRSPAYMGAVTTFLNGPGLAGCFAGLADAVRRGGTVAAEGGTTAPESPVWIDFARAMQAMARALAPSVADALCAGGLPRRVLDVAASHGLYGIELARRSPECTLVLQDWESVLAVARENAAAAGLGRRARTLAGSAFEVELGTGYDVILVPNFLHHFEPEACVRFLARCRAALAPRGRVAVIEFLLEEDRLTPPQSAAFDLVMLATTPRGEAYTRGEFARMLTAAGLEASAPIPLPGGTHALFVGAAEE